MNFRIPPDIFIFLGCGGNIVSISTSVVFYQPSIGLVNMGRYKRNKPFISLVNAKSCSVKILLRSLHVQTQSLIPLVLQIAIDNFRTI